MRFLSIWMPNLSEDSPIRYSPTTPSGHHPIAHTMIHSFKLTLSPTETLTLAVDMSQTPATFAAHPMGLATKYPTEYKQWLHEVVVPGLVALADQEQLEAFAEKGREVA